MTLDLTKPVQTRDGRKVRILCTDSNHRTYPVVALVTDDADGEEHVQTFTKEGGFYAGEPAVDDDLVNVPEEKVWFYNIYEHRSPMYPYRTAADAKEAMVGYGGASLAVVFEDGKFKRVEVL